MNTIYKRVVFENYIFFYYRIFKIFKIIKILIILIILIRIQNIQKSNYFDFFDSVGRFFFLIIFVKSGTRQLVYISTQLVILFSLFKSFSFRNYLFFFLLYQQNWLLNNVAIRLPTVAIDTFLSQYVLVELVYCLTCSVE